MIRWTLPALLLVCAAGCQVTPRVADPVRYYDFGIPRPAEERSACARRLALDKVAYAPMLARETMWYREGGASVEPRAFAISRLSAPPGALLEQHMRVALGVAESDRRAALPFRLSLKLETMEQIFVDDRTSEARLTVSAALTAEPEGRLVDSRVFSFAEAADQRSPGGGARAMARLVRSLGDQLRVWSCSSIAGDNNAPDSGL